jgi:hypothetical protein
MKRTIAVWAGAGLFLAIAWATYAAYIPMYRGSIQSATWTLLAITYPVAFASLKIGFPLKLVWALLLNTVTFATLGAMIEVIRLSVHRFHETPRGT